jgi:hypothetical protein
MAVSSEELGSDSDSGLSLDGAVPKKYKYAPLTLPNSTRVIAFEESTNGSDQVSISLMEIPLDGSVQYNAVSYTWDSQEPRIRVRCHNRYLRVTYNCHNIDPAKQQQP